MRNHVWRPFIVAAAAVVILLVVRAWYVPEDFGVHGRNFTYGFHRLSDIDFWAGFKVKYRTREYCRECHEENVASILDSPHGAIQCENCHGPAIDHPDDDTSLAITGSRLLCLRCHAFLPYPQSNRSDVIPPVVSDDHNPGENCIVCHNPHNPDPEEM